MKLDVDAYGVTNILMCFLQKTWHYDIKQQSILQNNLFTINIFVKQNYDIYSIFQLGKLFSYTWTMGEFSCKLLYYLQGVSGICSALNLTSLSIERYVGCTFLHFWHKLFRIKLIKHCLFSNTDTTSLFILWKHSIFVPFVKHKRLWL